MSVLENKLRKHIEQDVFGHSDCIFVVISL